jgi:hypothetical protein
VHSWNTFGVRTSHEQLGFKKFITAPNLGEVSIFHVPLHKAHIQMAFLSQDSELGVPKLPKLGLPQLWGPITSCAHLQLKWGFKQSCSPYRDLSNGMSHATCMQQNRVDSRLLVIKSQIVNLTPSPSFGHNLCFRFPNGSCKPILDIYVLRTFQSYKELLKPLRSLNTL